MLRIAKHFMLVQESLCRVTGAAAAAPGLSKCLSAAPGWLGAMEALIMATSRGIPKTKRHPRVGWRFGHRHCAVSYRQDTTNDRFPVEVGITYVTS